MNPFQAQYPLSPKKFWKKLIPALFGTFIWFVVLMGIVGVCVAIFANTNPMLAQIAGLIGVGILVLLVVYLSINIWYIKAYIRNYFYEGGDSFITIKKKVFTPQEIHVQYQKIQDVYVDQDLLDRIMGLFDVHIASATAASGIEAHIDGVDAATAEGLKNFFLGKIQNPGVAGPAVAAQDGVVPAMTTATPLAAVFTEDISDKTYPIQSGWMAKSIISTAFLSLGIGLFLSGYISFKTSTASSLGGGLPFLPTFAVITIGYFIVHIIGLFIWKSNYRFSFLPEYVQFHTGILSQSERHLPYRSIQDVTTSQSLLDRMFGLINVTIENAAQTAAPTTRYGRVASNNIILVGQTKESAQKIVEALKPVILSRSSAQTGL
jgi:uncharacterized membrane protein YdbT with pleckstrin-like domain